MGGNDEKQAAGQGLGLVVKEHGLTSQLKMTSLSCAKQMPGSYSVGQHPPNDL